MASPEADSRLNQVIVPALEKIIKNASWRKHTKLAAECKSVIEHLTSPGQNPTPTTSPASPSVQSDSGAGVLLDLSLHESDITLSPLINAVSVSYAKVSEPALDAVQKLIAHGYLHGEADSSGGSGAKLLAKLIDSVCKSHDLGDENAELLVIKTLLSAVTSVSLQIHGDSLLQVVKTCYDIYLSSKHIVNQTTAKASLIQMLVIVFRRMEADSSTVPLQPIVVAELMKPPEKGNVDASAQMFAQGFITKVIQDIDGVFSPGTPVENKTSTVEGTNPADVLDSTSKDMLDVKNKTTLEGWKGELVDGEGERYEDSEVQIGDKLRQDAFLVFRALCKLSIKTPPKDEASDPHATNGKIVALELLKILLENAGGVFRTSERFLDAIKQYLFLSLLKNSASTLTNVFQLSCSIFMSLVSRFRAGLKPEVGVFFPMIVLRVLENVAQPNFQQKMTVIQLLENLCVDSQILIEIFLNYDCDVNASNIFERIVNGLLKTSQGVPPGVSTTLQPPQDVAMKLEAMKCLVAILKCMGDWMNKQLRIPDSHFSRKSDAIDNDPGSPPSANGNADEPTEGSDTHSEPSSEVSEISMLEQRRAYKLELQEGVSLFNQKPKKGIEFLINANKVGNSAEEIADFLKSASGLNKTQIGDYLGEREDLSMKVMHAYVDSFEFQGKEFDEAIRVFLQGFRFPGEAQKIDRIMEKFAERYYKCNPKVFTSADTAYVLAYSVILLNTDAHNPVVKNKMSADDFIRNNRCIDDGKDLPEGYMRSLFERISRNEIKMKEDNLSIQQRQSVNSNSVLSLDSILNIVVQKRGEDSMDSSDDLMRHMKEQFKEKDRKSESIYYPATDVVILKFMIEVCWAPMLAAFSVPLDRSGDEFVIGLCLEGFCSAIHVTAAMSMKTHSDIFVTSLAKFTSLHSPADIKKKNMDAIKAIVTIADEDGNYLQEAWEHILTCVSRFEHLHLLGEGAPPDAAFFAIPQNELDKSKQTRSNVLPVLKKKGHGRIQNAVSAIRRGSYDSAGVGSNAAAGITSKQMNKLISNLNMLERVDEVNRIFIRSQKLNSEAILDFVKALCKVSMDELRSTSDPRVFSLTKIVEIAHYNMSRIRLVWSKIWQVLSDFFVTIGCSENLSIAIFAMDSLRQLSMKFLEIEELANYNFQNEFIKPFVVVMRKSSAVEIRELIIRCVSQMVLSRVNNVKSGWKSIFMVFTTAAYDDHKYIVLLSFEIIEKIVRDYFPYITETETTTFTDCVNCLIAFTNTRFKKEVSLNAIGFLRLCAVKLAEGDLGKKTDNGEPENKDDHLYLWFPLLSGLSELSFDPRPEIRKSAIQVLFDTLHNHGHHFTISLWEKVFESILSKISDDVQRAMDPSNGDAENLDQNARFYETCTLALHLVVDLFVNFHDKVNPLLKKILTLLVSFIKRPHQSLAGIGIGAFVRLMSTAGEMLSEDKWYDVVTSLKEASVETLPDFSFLLDEDSVNEGGSEGSDEALYGAISDVKCRAAVQLLLIQGVMEIYNMHRPKLSVENTVILFDGVHAVASHAHDVNSDKNLRAKLLEHGTATQMRDPPLLRLENESYQTCLTFLSNLVLNSHEESSSPQVESHLVELCKEVLQFYVEVASLSQAGGPRWMVPMGSARRRELAARAPLIVATLQAICSLAEGSMVCLFPLLARLISCEHGSSEVQLTLSDVLSSTVGPVLLRAS